MSRRAAVDGRTTAAKLIRDLERDLAEPLGGLANIKGVPLIAVQSAAQLSARLQTERLKQARGELVDGELLIRLTNAVNVECGALDARARAHAARADQVAA